MSNGETGQPPPLPDPGNPPPPPRPRRPIGEWGVYWRGATVLTLGFTVAALYLGNLYTALVVFFLSFIVLFPLYLGFMLARWLWKAGIGMFILGVIVLGAAPITGFLFGGLVLLVSRALFVHRLFKVQLLLLIFGAGGAFFVNPKIKEMDFSKFKITSLRQVALEGSSVLTEKDNEASDILLSFVAMELLHHEESKTFNEDVLAVLKQYGRSVPPLRLLALARHAQEGSLRVRAVGDRLDTALRWSSNEWWVCRWTPTSAIPPFAVSSTSGSAPFDAEPPPEVAARVVTPQPAPSGATAPKSNLTPFTDPLRLFSVQLPPGFWVTNKSAKGEAKSRLSFSYGPPVSISIIASPMSGAWNAEKAMKDKLAGIRSGAAKLPPNVTVEASGVIQLDGSPGYEISFSDGPVNGKTRMHSFTTVKDGASVSVAIVCTSKEQFKLFREIISAFRNTLKVGTGQVPAPPPTSAIVPPPPAPKPPAPPPARPRSGDLPSAGLQAPAAGGAHSQPGAWTPTDADWQIARAQIKTDGIMGSGEDQVVLIRNRIYRRGDVFEIRHENYTYRFRVDMLDARRVDFVPLKE